MITLPAFIYLSVSSSDRTSLQPRTCQLLRLDRDPFSILLGSNLASTHDRAVLVFQQLLFQYPPRIEPRFNSATLCASSSFFALSVSSSDRTSLQQTKPTASADLKRAFSILLGSNLASTSGAGSWRGSSVSFSILLGSNLASTERGQGNKNVKKSFQYPPRIEPRFNGDCWRYWPHITGLSVSSSDRTSLQHDYGSRTRPYVLIFQYPPLIEPRFNWFARVAFVFYAHLSVSSTTRPSLQIATATLTRTILCIYSSHIDSTILK